MYSAIGWNDRIKLGLRSEDFHSSRLHIKIQIQSSENQKDISYVHKRIRCIIDYVCMLFIDMDTAATVQQKIPIGARAYPVCAGAAGCLIN